MRKSNKIQSCQILVIRDKVQESEGSVNRQILKHFTRKNEAMEFHFKADDIMSYLHTHSKYLTEC